MTKITDENDNLVDVPDDEPKQRIDSSAPPAGLDPELLAMVRKQVIEEMKSEGEKVRQEKIIAREEAKKAHDAYVETMKNSSDPWVDIQGWVETSEGVRVELDWNDAFVEHLKSEGITGADEDQVVQQWVTLLLRDMTTQLEDGQPEQSEYS